jgi:hypothetical protein
MLGHSPAAAPAELVREPEHKLGVAIFLISALAIPLHRLRVVLRHASAGRVHRPEVELAIGVALLGCLAVPLIASPKFRGTPKPATYIVPRWPSALALPCSASGRKSRSAVA